MTVWPSGSNSIPIVTDEYGWRVHPIYGDLRLHSGTDLVGFSVNRAPKAGRIIFAQYNGGAGNEVRVMADNGDVFRIKHNASFYVSYGQRVDEGQAVGVMGTTGDSTGVHCHFECWLNGAYTVNPRDYMASAIAAGVGGITPIDQTSKGSKVTTLFHTKYDGTVKPSATILAIAAAQGWKINESKTLLALCGDGPVPLFTDPGDFANALGLVHNKGNGGNSVLLSPQSFNDWVATYWVRPAVVEVGDVELVAKSDPTLVALLTRVAAAAEATLAATKALNPPDTK